MRTNQLINYAGIAALVYVFATNLGGWLANKITVGAIKMKLGPTSPTGQNLTLYVPVKNASPVSYPLESFQGMLFWGENPLAQVVINQEVTITENATTEIPVSVFISFANLGTQLVSIISAGNWLAGANIKGMIRAGGFNVPIEQSIQLL